MEDPVKKHMRGLQALSDTELADELKKYEDEAFDYDLMLHECNLIIEELKGESARREMDQFWRKHPGLRLEVGNGLIYETPMFEPSQCVVEILEIDITNEQIIPRWPGSGRLNPVSIETARAMRSAFLLREKDV